MSDQLKRAIGRLKNKTMNWIESIKEITKAKNQNRLVIFVGSGVSNNSGIPTWKSLIKVMAQGIGYKCKHCKKPKGGRSCATCEEYDYDSSEFLRVPEYFFRRRSQAAYYKTIADTLNSQAAPNAIDEKIFDIMPQHIITTNYDTLLEDATSINTTLYKVICQDEELLSNTGDRYLIKMHGDINKVKTIVLKESDYIDYEQTHPLISTYVKALLVNSTFLFLGYSLNDYNLNLIIGWINYFCNKYGIEQRPKNFLVQSKKPNKFECARLKSSKIEVVSLTEVPLDDSVPKTLNHEDGKKLYVYLNCIADAKELSKYVPFSDLLSEKYSQFESYKKISQFDLLAAYRFGRYEILGNELFFFEKTDFERLASVINERNPIILDAFRRSGIARIHLNASIGKAQVDFDIPIKKETDDQSDVLLQKYLDNDYRYLSEAYDAMQCPDKIYYRNLLNRSDDINQLLEEDLKHIAKDNYIGMLLHRLRARLATLSLFDSQEQKEKDINEMLDHVPFKYKQAVGFIKKVNTSSAVDEKKMQQLLTDQQKRFDFNSGTYYSGGAYEVIWKLQAYAYDYFFTFIKNALPLNYFSDPNNYLSYYLEAILCSYSPIKKPDDNFCLSTDLKAFPFGEVDLDIFVKYRENHFIQRCIKQYSIQEFQIQDDVDLIKKFSNFCFTCETPLTENWDNKLLNFTTFVSMVNFKDHEKQEIYSAFSTMIAKCAKTRPFFVVDCANAIRIMVDAFSNPFFEKSNAQIIHALLDSKMRRTFESRNISVYSYILQKLSPYVTPEDKALLLAELDEIKDDSKKCNELYLYRKIIPIDNYAPYLNDHSELLSPNSLCRLLIEKTIEFNESVWTVFKEKLKTEKVARKAKGKCFPDYYLQTINECIILKLINYPVNLSELVEYAEDSAHLAFMLDPKSFDYSQVNLNDYMWQNLIYSKEYRQYFMDHKAALLTEDLENIFKRKRASDELQKVVYGVLLDTDELRMYGE